MKNTLDILFENVQNSSICTEKVMKMSDIRTEKTKENIGNAFFTILAFDNYRDITVNQICQYARCSRSTFYAHYESKDQLYEEIVDNYMKRYHYYIIQKFEPNSDFRKLFSAFMTELIIPEKDKISKLLAIDLHEGGFQSRFEDLCKEMFLSNYRHIKGRDIIAEMWSASSVKALRAMIDGRLSQEDMEVIEMLQGELFRLIG